LRCRHGFVDTPINHKPFRPECIPSEKSRDRGDRNQKFPLFHFRISLFLYQFHDAESEFAEHSYGARLTTLEVTRAKLLPRGELISCAQDRLGRVTAFISDQLIGRGRGETML
jgi:hypothetical protein